MYSLFPLHQTMNHFRLFDNSPISDFNHSLALLCHAHVVRDDNDRLALLMQSLENFHDFIRCPGVKRTGWLVSKDDRVRSRLLLRLLHAVFVRLRAR